MRRLCTLKATGHGNSAGKKLEPINFKFVLNSNTFEAHSNILTKVGLGEHLPITIFKQLFRKKDCNASKKWNSQTLHLISTIAHACIMCATAAAHHAESYTDDDSF